MQILSAPIVLGQKGTAVAKLQELIFWFINNNHLVISEGLDLDNLSLLSEEQTLQLYSRATAYFVAKIYTVVGGWAGEPNQINESAANQIEVFFLAHQEVDTYKVYGSVVNENGVGVSNVTVAALLKRLREETAIISVQSDAKGYYEMEIGSVSDPTGNNLKTALQLQATSATGERVDSPLIFNVGKTTNVDLILPITSDSAVETEFQLIEAKVEQTVGTLALPNLTHQDLDFLKSINENEVILSTYLYAVEYALKAGGAIEVETFYGLLRVNGIAPYQTIFNWSEEQITPLLSKAVDANYIAFSNPTEIQGLSEGIKGIAVSLITESINQSPSDASTIRILKTALNDEQVTDFLTYYNSTDTLDTSFWKEENLSQAIPSASPIVVGNLKKALGHAINTGNNPSLVNEIMTSSLVEIVSQSKVEWRNMLDGLSGQPNFVIPAVITGSNTGERLDKYANSLYEIYSNSYKTEYAQAKLTTGNASIVFPTLNGSLESFVFANPDFDILRTPVAKLTDGTYNLPSDGAAFIEEVGKVQRLNALTNNFDAIEGMVAADVSSATDIIQMTQAEFQQAFSAKLGGNANALAVYEKALSVEMTSQLLTLNAYQVYQVDFPVIYNINPTTPAPGSQPEWRSLFGNVDYCTCEHCQSVFSPAAYFVDSMELLRRFDATTSTTLAYNWLKAKRPDLWDLKLTCKNTNTSIPTIDIVNETLEAVIGTASSTPNLVNLSVAQDTLSDARLNRAIPEHINSAGTNTPYHKLMEAKYPWSSPYNYYADQSRAYLKIIDLKPYQIAQAFSEESYPKTLNTKDLAGLYLGITTQTNGTLNSDLEILTDDTLSNLRQYYGLVKADGITAKSSIANPANRLDVIAVPTGTLWGSQGSFLGKVNVFLQQSQLSFEDLLALLDCQYVNPVVGYGTSAVRKLRIEGNPETTCDTDKLFIKVDPAGGNFSNYDFEQHFLFNAMRIARLSQKTGLSNYDVDKILTAYGLAYDDPFTEEVIVFMAQVLRTKEILNATLEEVLTLLSDFPHRRYNNYNSDRPQQIPTFYERLFRNQSVVPDFDKIAAYPFKKLSLYDDWITPPVSATYEYEQMRSWVLAIFKLSSKDLDFLIKNFYGDAKLFPIPTDFVTPTGEFIFSHDNILDVYREITLARLLNLSIEKWVSYRRWIFRHGTDNQPFISSTIPDANLLLRFVEKIKVFEQQPLPFEVLRYALWDGVGDLQEKELTRNTLISQLRELRDILSKFNLDYQDLSGTTSVINSKKLQNLLLSLVAPQDADFLINTVALKDNPASNSFSPTEIQRFKDLLPETLSTADETTLFGDGTVVPNADKQERLQVLVNIFLPTLKENANRKEPVSYLSAQNGISTEITELLLSDFIEVAGEKGLRILMDELFVKSTQPITVANLNTPPTQNLFQNPFKVIEKLYKVALVVNSLNLSVEEFLVFKQYYELLVNNVAVGSLANPTSGNLLNANVGDWPDDLSASYNFIEWMQLRKAFVPSPLGLHYVLSETSNASNALKKETWILAMSKALQIAESEIEVLVGKKISDTDLGALNFDFAVGLPQPFQYRNLFAALDMMQWLETSASVSNEIAKAVLSAGTQSDADKIIQVVRARYGKTEWLDVVQPVSDVLRVNRRDAMVAYLLAFPPDDYANRWSRELDIYETLLIDTQVMPVVQTSRVRQAISSLQMFFDRCILQKEVSLSMNLVVLGGEAIRQWNMWRKWYRVWEANRKVFVYPENWIEPELRDDKSPFFKDLEKFVNQNDITLETMEDAYRGYLERLDEVAFLDIIGYYIEDVQADNGSVLDSIVHTFGRTRSYPYIYHYRKRVNNVWNAWEKMEAQIDGDHFVPVMWRGRLRLYWVTFLEKLIPESPKIRLDEEQRPPQIQHEILLHWTEFKNGNWTPSQLGNKNAVMNFGGDATNSATAADLKYHIKRWYSSNSGDWAEAGLAHTQKSFKKEIARMKERLLLYAVKGDDGQLYIECASYMEGLTFKQFKHFLYTKYSKNWGSTEDDENGWFGDQNSTSDIPPGYKQANGNNVKDKAITDALDWNTEWFTGRLDQFYENPNENNAPLRRVFGRPCFVIKHNKVEVTEWKNYTQYNSYIDNALFDQKNNAYIYPRNKKIGAGYEQLTSLTTPSTGNGVYNRVKLLGEAPDFSSAPAKEKYFILQKQHPESYQPVKIPKFFYQDYENLFFVEKVGSDNYVEVSEGVFTVKDTNLGGLSIGLTSISASTGGTDFASILDSTSTTGSIRDTLPFYSSTAYRFHSFYHYRVNDLLEKLGTTGIKGLFEWTFTVLSQVGDKMDFKGTYKPTGAVAGIVNDNLYPTDALDFSLDAPNAIYNWELFFHIPMFIANKLVQEQRFMEAMDWYHLVFNPTNQADDSHGGSGPARFWQFFPFFEHAKNGVPSIGDIMANPSLPIAVQQWAQDPFKPHLIARNRTGAYMRNAVMKYLDNLIAWGDNLFRRDTAESIDEAMLLYVLAAQIIGRRPIKIPARLSTEPLDYQDFLTLAPNAINAFSNALVPIQTYLATTPVPTPNIAQTGMYYFCIPPNEKLLSYWDIVADRLHKIRNSQSIDGVERQLALFAPPIDPAMLVRAAAAGISIADAVAELYAPLPAYRFPTMVQKATELAQEVKSLGGALLAAIEKRDAEQLALLRSVQEQKVLEAAKETRALQIQEAQTQVTGMREQKELINERIKHYQLLVDKGLNREEQSQLDSLQASIPLKVAQGDLSTLASVYSAIPSFSLLAPFSIGPTFGGPNMASLVNAGATAIGTAATVNDIKGSMAGVKAGYMRRREEWDMQLKLANREIKQIDKQIIAAEIRESIALKEMRVQEIQIQNARDMDLAMHDKYSNEDLYNWMISEISYTYFQSYKLAFDIARKAERCYRYELGVEPVKDFIQFGYWNSLKKGLLAADNLLFDVKRLEMAYLEQNVRSHEMSKSISLAATDPVALIKLRVTGQADIALPEWIFDMDYPGHYFRRIKSVSISIPCVAGPYTTVAAKLTLISSRYRKNALSGATANGYKEGDTDPRFNYLFNGGQSIATSTAQNDSGMFDLNFRDERFLPFEGCGVVSNWKLDLPSVYANYDRATITDVIIHVNYTARFDGGLANGAKSYLGDLMEDDNLTEDPKGIPPYHLMSLKHEFSTEWYAAFQNTVAVTGPPDLGNIGRQLFIVLRKSQFPIGVQDKDIVVTGIRLISRTDSDANYKFNINATSAVDVMKNVVGTSSVLPTLNPITDSQPQNLDIVLYKEISNNAVAMAETELEDLYMLIEYKLV